MALFVLALHAQGERSMNAPGTCVDCGNEAYIRLAGGDGETMICAHCFAMRHPAERPAAAAEGPGRAGRGHTGSRAPMREAVPARRPAAE